MSQEEIKERVHKELMELDGKIGRLQLMLKNTSNRGIMSAYHWRLLNIQLASMQTYAECLASRLAEFDELAEPHKPKIEPTS